MEWFILSRDMHVLAAPSTDADDSLPIFDDKQVVALQNNTVVSTYDFSVQQKHPDANNLQMGNYIAFKDKKGKTRLYTLMSFDGDDLVRNWHAEDIGLDLLNETADKWDYTKEPHGIEWYFSNLVLKDTGWSIGVNEISNLTRGLKFEGQSDTQLKRLGDIANQFGNAEIDFSIEMTGSYVTSQVVNIYQKIGTSVTQQRFVDSVNLISLHSSGSIENLCTSLTGYGSQPDSKESEETPPIDISGIKYDDGQFFSPLGDKNLYDRLNHQKWSRHSGFNPNNKNETKGYINGIFTYDTKDPNELLKRMITELKTRNSPSLVYESNLLDINADIGDMVQIAHNNYNPPVYLSARVQRVENCYTEKGQDTGILGDYTALESKIDPRVKEILDELRNQIKSVFMWVRYASDDQGNGMTATPTSDTKYVAILPNKPTAVPSDDPADYKGHWQLMQGKDGKDGIGIPGADGNTSYMHFAYANNVSGTEDFSLDDPTGRDYMGVYTDFVKEDSTNPKLYRWSYTRGNQGAQGRPGEQGIPGAPGADGKIPYFHTAWATSADGKQGFSTTDPNGKTYLGTYTDYTQADSNDPTKYAWSLIKGKDGSDGAPGKPGADGKTPYFHQAWADSKDGKTGFSTTDSANKSYLGTYTDFTQADSTDPTKYFWVELVGNLVIGGRNYILKSETYTAEMGVKVVMHLSEIIGYFSKKSLVLSCRVDFDNHVAGSKNRYGMEVNFVGADGKKYFVDVWKTAVVGESFHGTVHALFNLPDIPPTNDSYELALHNQSMTPKSTITKPKVEIGNKATDWSPAPEDAQNQIDTINKGLADTNAKIAAVPKVTPSKTAPTNPKTGDQWWVIAKDPVTDEEGINNFKKWDGSKWVDITITQSLLVIKELDAVNINGSVINGSKFTNAFTFNDMLGVKYTGVTAIADGAVKITYKIPSKNQTGETMLQADMLSQKVFDSKGSVVGLSLLSPASLQLQTNGVGGFLTPEDLIRYGPESWSNNDAGGTYTIAFERRWGRVWVTGELLLPTSSFGNYHTMFKIQTPGLRPKKNRWFVGMRTGNAPVAGEIEMRPDGDFVVIGVPEGGRHTFEGVSYSLGNE